VRHVAPHRWAEAASGRVDAAERAAMTAHAAGCPRCAAARDRVIGARAAFAGISEATAPELRWEELRARIYWSTSQERRRTGEQQAVARPRRTWLVMPALAMAAAATGAVWVAARTRVPTVTAQPLAAAPAEPVGDVMPIELVDLTGMPAPPLPRVGLVTLAQGDAHVAAAGGAHVLAQPVVAGLRLDTGEGRLAVQLEAGTAFAIGPRTTLDVARLDGAAIELRVDGEISVEVAHRAPNQRFVIAAGERTVEVRGTAFEVVHHRGRVEVRCRHGLVAVRDGDGAVVEVPGGHGWVAAPGESLLAHAPAPLSEDALEAIAERAPVTLPAWTDPGTLVRTTGPVTVASPRNRAVRVDGVTVGRGALTVRVMSGRHLVETERAPGRFAAGQWVATRDDGATAEVVAAADPIPPGRAIARRRAQLDRNVDHAHVAGCLRSLAKQGLASGTHVVLEIGVDATGAISFLNVGETDLPRTTAACVRDVVAGVRFPAGPEATWQHRFQF